MWIFVGLSFGTLFFTFLSTMPALTATLRLVYIQIAFQKRKLLECPLQIASASIIAYIQLIKYLMKELKADLQFSAKIVLFFGCFTLFLSRVQYSTTLQLFKERTLHTILLCLVSIFYFLKSYIKKAENVRLIRSNLVCSSMIQYTIRGRNVVDTAPVIHKVVRQCTISHYISQN